MILNYLKLGLRAFKSRRLTSVINIAGLTLGIACACIAYVFIQHENSFNRFHEESEKIHSFYVNINERLNVSGTPGPLAAALVEEFPEVTEAVRLEKAGLYIKSGTEVYAENVLFADKEFFEFFTFPLISGIKETVLVEPNAIVLNEKSAIKYFGRKDPVGETLSLIYKNKEQLFTISGVAKNPPTNSSIQFDFVLPITSAYPMDKTNLESNWGNFPLGTFFRFRELADIPSFTEKLPLFVQDKMIESEDDKYKFQLVALNDYHLNNPMRINGLAQPGEARYVRILSIISILILLVACLNFMNLANAQSSRRFKEVGVRQVLGARPGQLMTQFLSESVVLALVALGIAIGLIVNVLPFAQSLFSYPLEFQWTEPDVLLVLLTIAVGTGLLAGSYPAFLLSRLSANSTFKPHLKVGGNNWITKSSLIIQFALSIGLVICMTVMQQQQQFISETNLGFNQEEVMVIPTQVNYFDKFDTGRFVKQFRNSLKTNEGVKEIAGVSNSFNRGNRVQFIQEEDGTNAFIFEYRVDPEYIELLDIELLDGRNFSDEIAEDQEQSVVINESFAKKYNIDQIEGYQFPTSFGDAFTNKKIIGVVKDYHFNHLRSDIRPMYLTMSPEYHFEHMLVKVDPSQIKTTLAQLKTTWQSLRSDKPFEYYFLDEDLQKQYEAESRWSKVISGASLLATIIAMLGLFGLMSLVLIERTKEISIRKILGARLGNMLGLLSIDFIKLALVSSIIAIPASWYFMQQWLENFAYRIDIEWWVFVVASIVIIGLALIIIGVQITRAIFANPVEALRDE